MIPSPQRALVQAFVQASVFTSFSSSQSSPGRRCHHRTRPQYNPFDTPPGSSLLSSPSQSSLPNQMMLSPQRASSQASVHPSLGERFPSSSLVLIVFCYRILNCTVDRSHRHLKVTIITGFSRIVVHCHIERSSSGRVLFTTRECDGTGHSSIVVNEAQCGRRLRSTAPSTDYR